MHMDALELFRVEMNRAGIPYSGPITADGRLHRFNADGEKGQASWYFLIQLDHAKFYGEYGCFRRNIRNYFKSWHNEPISSEQAREMREKMQRAAAERRAEEQRVRESARERAQAIMKATIAPPADHPYLKRKGVGVHGQLRFLQTCPDQELLNGCLVLPLYNTRGELQTIEFIAPDKRFGHNSDKRDKQLLFGGDPKGHFFTIHDSGSGPIVICEGYATGASIYEATGLDTVCARSNGNLAPVAQALHQAHPTRPIIIAADNDRFTPNNPGLTAAQKAAQLVKGHVVWPEFSDQDTTSTDFNDLYLLAGRQAVRSVFRTHLATFPDWTVLVEDAAIDTTDIHIPEPIELVSSLIPEQAKTVIGGSSKTYKTWFATDLAVSIATGSHFLNLPTQQRTVLYVNLELKPPTFKRRLQAIANAKQVSLPPNSLYELHLRGKLAGLQITDIVGRILHIANKFNIQVAILDPLFKLNTAGDENSAFIQTQLFNQLDRLVTTANLTLIFTDHFSKGSQAEKDPLDAIRGSSAKGGDVDCAIILRAHQEPNAFSVHIVHRELPPVDPFVIRWSFPLMTPADELNPANMKQPHQPGRPFSQPSFHQLLAPIITRTKNNPISFPEWAALTNTPITTLKRIAVQLIAKGFITSVGEGTKAKKAITQEGIQFVQNLTA